MAEKNRLARNFENRVARLYRSIGAEVKRGYPCVRKEVDVYVEERTTSGLTVRTAVECKHSQRGRIGLDTVNRVGRWAAAWRDAHQVDKVVLITTVGFTKDAWGTAEEEDIELLLIDDLRARVKLVHAGRDQAERALQLHEEGVRTWTDADALTAAVETGHAPWHRGLTAACVRWLTFSQRKAGPRLRVFWIVGRPVSRRHQALRACLSLATMRGHAVHDTDTDLGLAAEALERAAGFRESRAPQLIAVDLVKPDLDQVAWSEVRSVVADAVEEKGRGASFPAALMVAGTRAQLQAAAASLPSLLEVDVVDPSGLPQARPEAHDPLRPAIERIYNRGLPMTEKRLFGRDAESDHLHAAWASDIQILSFVALGGAGKSALVNNWLAELDPGSDDQPEWVFAWSFYSQGTKENLVSADAFVSAALMWLGDESAVSLNPGAKGRRLAQHIRSRPGFLLVLDGLEPLQHPIQEPDLAGQLTDDSIRSLLEALAQPGWDGLCVSATRVPVADLRVFEPGQAQSEGTVDRRDLKPLDPRPARQLLEHILGRELEPGDADPVIAMTGRHGLAISLLGRYLRDVHGGDLAGVADLAGRLPVREELGGHARRVIQATVRWLGANGRQAELRLLRTIGLFDRPAEFDALNALLADPLLGPAMDPLDRVGSAVWDEAVSTLRRMGLLTEPGENVLAETIDAHPLVREHFRDGLEKRQNGRLWRHGNRILFDYYRLQARPRPRTSAGMQPLYAAVTHGCAAGLHREVFDAVLLERIWRDRRTNFSTRRLGMTGADLVALSNYFRGRSWTELRDVGLPPAAQVLIRTNAGVRLRQLGRLVEARGCFSRVVGQVDPERAGPQDLEDASYAAAQNCELLVIAGRLNGPRTDTALATGRRAVEYADGGGDPYFTMHARSSLAEVYFMLGSLDRAKAWFDEAKEIDRSRRPRPPFLYSQGLFRYGYYLIERGMARRIIDGYRRWPRTWGTNANDSSLLSEAIRLVVLGAAHRSLVERGDRSAARLRQASSTIDEAVEKFGSAGYADYVVRGLLERIRFLRVRNGSDDDRDGARRDLTKAMYEVRRGRMDLLHVDVLLEQAACAMAFAEAGSFDHAELFDALDMAAGRIDRLGYERRRARLDRLREETVAFD